MNVPSSSGDCSRLSSNTRLIDLSGVVCGLIGGKSDWKAVVVRDSRCFGTFEFAPELGLLKLFITNFDGVSLAHNVGEVNGTYQWRGDVLFAASLRVPLRSPDVLGERVLLNSEMERRTARRDSQAQIGISRLGPREKKEMGDTQWTAHGNVVS